MLVSNGVYKILDFGQLIWFPVLLFWRSPHIFAGRKVIIILRLEILIQVTWMRSNSTDSFLLFVSIRTKRLNNVYHLKRVSPITTSAKITLGGLTMCVWSLIDFNMIEDLRTLGAGAPLASKSGELRSAEWTAYIWMVWRSIIKYILLQVLYNCLTSLQSYTFQFRSKLFFILLETLYEYSELLVYHFYRFEFALHLVNLSRILFNWGGGILHSNFNL